MKIWTITYNDDNGSPDCEVFNTEEGVEAAAREWIDAYQGDYPNVDFNRPWRDVFDSLTEQLGFMDSITVQTHNVSQPTPPPDSLETIMIENVKCDDELEVDGNAVVSWGDDAGAFVQTWSWVPFDDVEQPMAIIEGNGTVWYFDQFAEFMEAMAGMPETARYTRGTPELLEKSTGVNDAWEFLTAKDDSLKLQDFPLEGLQERRRRGD